MIVEETLEEYHQNPALSSSKLKDMLISPRLFKAKHIDRVIPWKQSKSLDFGSAAHLALLEPQAFRQRFVVEPDLRRNTNAYKDWKEEVLLSFPNALLISQEDTDRIRWIVDAIQADELAHAMLRAGVPEQSFRLEHPEYKCAVQVRPDFIHGGDGPRAGDIIDVKTTRDCSFRRFRNQVWEYRYDLSIKFHMDMVDLELGHNPDRNAWWIAIETEPPCDVAVYRANDMPLNYGEAGYRKAILRYLDCVRDNRWPGKQSAPQDMDLPAWVEFE